MDKRGHINKAHHKRMPKKMLNKVTRYYVATKDYWKEGVLHL